MYQSTQHSARFLSVKVSEILLCMRADKASWPQGTDEGRNTSRLDHRWRAYSSWHCRQPEPCVAWAPLAPES